MIVTMHAIEVAETGGPEVLRYVEKPQPSPARRGADQGRGDRRQLHRHLFPSGHVPAPSCRSSWAPKWAARSPPWATASTALERRRPGGDRVGCRRLCRILHCPSTIQRRRCPTAVISDVAASALLKGMTAHYLIKSVYPVQAGDTVLVHAGAGGVGLILTQWATSLGVRVITTVSTPAKAELSRQAGADRGARLPRRCRTSSASNPATDRRGGRGRGVRRRGREHVRRQPGQPRGAGNVGVVRRIQRPGSAVRPAAAQRGRLGVPDPPDAGALHPHRRGVRWRCRRIVRRDRRRYARRNGEPELSAGRRRPSAPRLARDGHQHRDQAQDEFRGATPASRR